MWDVLWKTVDEEAYKIRKQKVVAKLLAWTSVKARSQYMDFVFLLILYQVTTPTSYKCYFVGGLCDTLHIVDIGLLQCKPLLSHADLDVRAWLPGSPYLLPSYASVKDSRKTYHQGSGVSGLGLPPASQTGDTYTVVHYDQVSISYHVCILSPFTCNMTLQYSFHNYFRKIADAQNHLLNTIIQNEEPVWYGEILIVKCNAAGLPVNVTNDDDSFVPAILKRYVIITFRLFLLCLLLDILHRLTAPGLYAYFDKVEQYIIHRL